MTLEIEIEAAVCAFAERQGWLTRKLAWVGRRGAPDRIYFKDGRVILIEFKSPTGKLSKLQELEITRLLALGIEVHVINDIDKGKGIFK